MKLRPMIMADADKMLEWKNYGETRQFAIATHNNIQREDHLYWLVNHILEFQVILEDDQVAGAIRIDKEEVSVWIDREFRGRNLASHAVSAVSKKDFKAKIVAGNIASMRCFIKCGYYPVEFHGSYYVFQKV